MSSHLLWMLVFAALVSIVFAVLVREDPRAQLRTAALMFGGFAVTALILGWLMYPLPL